MFDYDPVLTKAAAMIKNFGTEATFTKTAPVYDIYGNLLSSEVTTSTTYIVEIGSPVSVIDQTLLEKNIVELYALDLTDYIIEINDVISYNGLEHQIIDPLHIFKPSGKTLLYTIRAKLLPD